MILDLFQLILGIAVIFLILIQQRGAEGGVLFGSQADFFFKRRGFEEKIYYLTWILVIGFVLISLVKII